jgi:hypothetical protein
MAHQAGQSRDHRHRVFPNRRESSLASICSKIELTQASLFDHLISVLLVLKTKHNFLVTWYRGSNKSHFEDCMVRCIS